jgi:4-amino-4-deoxy-L-arabinose transferase-like glycosyltransferase
MVRPPLRLIAAIVFMALVRLLIAALAPLTDDEAYYRLLALVPAMSYFDHPPMIAWMIAAGRWLVGDNAIGIRLAAPLISLIGPFILWRAASILFDWETAERATWIALAMPLLAVGGVIITPDTPSVLFWGLTVWAMAELQISRNAYWWLAIGLFSGLGLLSKYTNLFLGAGIGLWILWIPAHRPWLRSWQLWFAVALAGALALPVVIWNTQHEWASFARQFGRVAWGGESLTLRYIFEFIGAFLGLASPVIAILAAWGVWMVVRGAIRTQNPSKAILVVVIMPLLLYFIVHATHDRVQPNWPAPLYPSLALCAAIAISRVAQPHTRRWLQSGAIGFGFVLCGLLYAHAISPLPIGQSIADPTSQMRGWAQLAAEVEKLRVDHAAKWIATSGYATTSQLSFQLKSAPPVVQINERLRYAHLPPIDAQILQAPAIYVELRRNLVLPLLQQRFASVMEIGKLTRQYRGTTLDTYVVYRIADPIGPVLRP